MTSASSKPATPFQAPTSLAAGRAVLDAVSELQVGDLVICLLSGGGSALMEQPLPGLTLEALQALTRRLLASGASVAELNAVRKHLSAIKGGRLALAAWPARIETFALSDVVGDDRAAIASGPTVADPTTLDAARGHSPAMRSRPSADTLRNAQAWRPASRAIALHPGRHAP